ncbi:DUF1996 and WSC domain-containing protein [Phanerochaete sordida]|uniref:DUF1996 and WSC domain-containing protein n=1 Tax=Phanerochaete sordida TaxID=48140 RepID=A0A9P3FZG3_9APHY|nr:DUF1996 and WSC domain-containing protein [Phanerochaete sordida]
MFSSKLGFAFAVLAALPAARASSHFIMGGLTPMAYERIDPIVNPGIVSTHVHALIGANNVDQNSDYDSIRTASCTSAPFQKVDMSVYWAPNTYYQDQNTHQFTLMQSTFNIYYFFDRNGPGEKVNAFPQGLRMVAGSPTRDTYNASNFADQAISFVCLDYSGAVSNDPAYAERQDLNFPDPNKCEDGIRMQVFFPQCWDGQNLDSSDHKSHMAYPVDNYNSGTCPSSHPVHTVAIFYEQIIPVSQYKYWGQGAYVLTTGDPTGLAYHADFLMGWDQSVLQDAVDNCHNMNGDINACQVLQPYIDQNAAKACTLAADVVNEDVGLNGSQLSALPGCNPVRTDFSTPASCPGQASPQFGKTVAALTPGWSDLGCIAEGTSGRALTGASTTSPNMTLNACAAYCGAGGFAFAGVEFGDECYCGNTLANGASQTPVASDQCSTACAGNPQYEKCGGPQRLELLQATGGAPAPAPNASGVSSASSSVASLVSSTVSDSASASASTSASASSSASASASANTTAPLQRRARHYGRQHHRRTNRL